MTKIRRFFKESARKTREYWRMGLDHRNTFFMGKSQTFRKTYMVIYEIFHPWNFIHRGYK